VSGDIDVERVEGSLLARAVSGDARIISVRGPLTLTTTSGDARIESVEAGEVTFQSVSGDARIGVSRGTRVWIDATSVSGDLESELGLADHEDMSEREASETDAGRDQSSAESRPSGDVTIVAPPHPRGRRPEACRPHGRDDLVVAALDERSASFRLPVGRAGTS
jgi:DUF4097 and DUF4098 domain-containing protein YvlB